MSLSSTRIPKLLALAGGQPCALCGADDKTIVAAHYQGHRSLAYGKWKGIKPHDAMSAHLCYRCHMSADSSKLANDRVEHSRVFLRLIVFSHLRLYLNGQLYADKVAGRMLIEICHAATSLMTETEAELNRIAVGIAQHFDRGGLQPITRRGASVGDFLGVTYAGC